LVEQKELLTLVMERLEKAKL